MQYIKITRTDAEGSCTVALGEIRHIIETELDGTATGESVTLTVIEMSPEAYEELPEFNGW